MCHNIRRQKNPVYWSGYNCSLQKLMHLTLDYKEQFPFYNDPQPEDLPLGSNIRPSR